MQKLTLRRFLSVLLLIPTIDAAAAAGFDADLYNDRFQMSNSDCMLILRVEGLDTNIHIPAHKDVLGKIPAFTNVFGDDEKSESYVYSFKRSEEVSAFQKIIAFLYKISAPNIADQRLQLKPFFEPRDLADLIFLAARYEIEPLGKGIANFLYVQIHEMLNAREDLKTILDHMTAEQFHYFYYKMHSIEQNENWIKAINAFIVHYIQHVFFKNDPRLKGLPIKANAQIYQSIHAVQHGLWEEHASELADREEARKQGVLRERAKKSAEDIFARYQAYLSSHHKGPTVVKSRSYRVAKEIADLTLAHLIVKLPAYDVFLDPKFEDWSPDSDLWTGLPSQCTPGCCLAGGLGWTSCLLLYPFQILTLNFFGCCDQDPPQHDDMFDSSRHTCWCNTRLGGAVAHAAYNMASCNSRWITIMPKADPSLHNLVLPPPPEDGFER